MAGFSRARGKTLKTYVTTLQTNDSPLNRHSYLRPPARSLTLEDPHGLYLLMGIPLRIRVFHKLIQMHGRS